MTSINTSSNLVSYSANDSDTNSDDEEQDSRSKQQISKAKRCLDTDSLHDEDISKHKHLKTESKESNVSDRLPLPDAIINMFHTEESHKDDPDAHGGRKRTFAHERGSWASYVYALVDEEELISGLYELRDDLLSILKPIANFTAQEALHISLSRTFKLRHHWIDPLVTSLRKNVNSLPGCLCEMTTPKIYCNDERTRTFLGIQIGGNTKPLKEYVKAIDESLKEFRLPLYYEEPSFHISLAWAVGDLADKIEANHLKDLQASAQDYFAENPTDSIVRIRQLRIKSGIRTCYLNLDAE